MLTENKFSKYLIYAFGEILLVVIGILIALSINNWNENQIEIKTVHNYLKKIESNIQQDLKMSQNLLEFRINHSSQCAEASKMLINRDFSDQATIQSAVLGLLIEIPLNFNRSAFESLKSSGNLSKIENSNIENLIYDYYNLVDNIENQENDLLKWCNELELELDKNGFGYKWLELDTKIHQDLTKQITLYNDKLCEHPGHLIIATLLFRGATNTTFLTPLYENQIKAGEKLSQAIKNYVNHK
ncbi:MULTISPECIES: DUF6090 family protein [unclassified Polaribacter]|uniref:DUF6090 family protein n=1 Tax=unclassified Polaribacter TaxID=196858 RepID=UPI00167567AE|nr:MULTISPECIES: DUF6090 family protein [unclassified Polaribacter]